MKLDILTMYKSIYNLVSEETLGNRVYAIFSTNDGKYEYITLITSKDGVKKAPCYGWSTLEKAQNFINQKIEDQKASIESAARRRKEASEGAKKFIDSLNIGDILSATWGYEATWYEFYKVIGKQGSFVLLRELKKNTTHEGCQYGWASHGIVSPSDEFYGDEIIKRKAGDGYVRINSYTYAHRWDGKAREEANWH